MKIRVLALLLVLLAYQSSLYSQWSQTNGPMGKVDVRTLIPADSLLFGLTQCGIYHTGNPELDWQLDNAGSFSVYTRLGDTVYLGDKYSSVFMLDLGQPSDPLASLSISNVLSLGTDGQRLYACQEYGGFQVSYDRGVNWSIENTGLPTQTMWTPYGPITIYNVYAIAADSNTVYAGTHQGIYRATPDSFQWVSANTGLPTTAVKYIVCVGDTVFTAIGDKLYRSTDDGQSWNQVFSTSSQVNSVYGINGWLYATTAGEGVFSSSDGGLNWTAMNTGLIDLVVNCISVWNGVPVCGTSGKGIFFWENGQWVARNQRIICSTIWSMDANDAFLVASEPYGVYRSTDGQDWADIPPAMPSELFSDVILAGDTIFLSVEYDVPIDNPYIAYSTDTGNTWNNLNSQPPFAGDDPYGIHYHIGRLYASENETMYYSDDLGLWWMDMSLPSQFCNYFYGFTVFADIPFGAACCCGQIVRWDDSQGWVLSNNGLPTNRDPGGLAWCDSAIFAYIYGAGMYVSRDTGNYWSFAGNGLSTDEGFRDFVAYGSNLFLATQHGVFFTSNYGEHWFPVNDQLVNTNVGSLAIRNDTLYAGTYGNGVWKHPISSIPLSIKEPLPAVSTLGLHPNPASDMVKVHWQGPAAMELGVFDISGREVMGAILQSGAQLDVSALGTGFYSLRGVSGNKNYTGKLTVMR